MSVDRAENHIPDCVFDAAQRVIKRARARGGKGSWTYLQDQGIVLGLLWARYCGEPDMEAAAQGVGIAGATVRRWIDIGGKEAEELAEKGNIGVCEASAEYQFAVEWNRLLQNTVHEVMGAWRRDAMKEDGDWRSRQGFVFVARKDLRSDNKPQGNLMIEGGININLIKNVQEVHGMSMAQLMEERRQLECALAQIEAGAKERMELVEADECGD